MKTHTRNILFLAFAGVAFSQAVETEATNGASVDQTEAEVTSWKSALAENTCDAYYTHYCRFPRSGRFSRLSGTVTADIVQTFVAGAGDTDLDIGDTYLSFRVRDKPSFVGRAPIGVADDMADGLVSIERIGALFRGKSLGAKEGISLLYVPTTKTKNRSSYIVAAYQSKEDENAQIAALQEAEDQRIRALQDAEAQRLRSLEAARKAEEAAVEKSGLSSAEIDELKRKLEDAVKVSDHYKAYLFSAILSKHLDLPFRRDRLNASSELSAAEVQAANKEALELFNELRRESNK